MIGRKYRYPNSKRVFTLVAIEGYVYIFKCGHRVMDSVFMDLIDIKTGIANWKNNQLTLF
jgi:hypothetical protein